MISDPNRHGSSLDMEKIYKLPQLQILDLGRNNLSRVPEEIKNMKALRVLSLMNNNIIMVPLVIGFLDNLKILKLSGNPLNDGLKSVIDGIDGSPSPLVVPIAENEKDANVTKKIKKYLKAEAASLESGGESRYVTEPSDWILTVLNISMK